MTMGSSTTVQQPAAPAAPTTAQNMSDYVNNYPALMALEQQYNPQQAQLEYQIASQYGPQYAALVKGVNEQLYPKTANLQEDLAGQATTGMSQGGLPDAIRQQYLDQLRAEVGPNAGSGIGADYVSRGMVQQGEQYKNYYQNLALSLAGRQPLSGYATPGYQNAGEGYNYGQVANNNTQGYGSYAGLYGNMYNTNASMAQYNANKPYKMAGTAIGGFSAMFPGGL